MNDFLLLITKLSSGAVLLVGCLLLGLNIPPDPKLKNYRIARRSIAGAYIVLAVSDWYRLLVDDIDQYFDTTLSITLIIAFFQAFLFTYAMITLIDYRAVTKRKALWHLVFIALVSTSIILSKLLLPEFISCSILYAGCAIYMLYLIYCLRLFRKHYKEYKIRMDNFYSADESKRLTWINNVFYMALSIGVLALLSIFSTPLLYSLFTVIYTLFYIYTGIKYINYISTFHYISRLVNADNELKQDPMQTYADNDLEIKIKQWTADKMYTNINITLDSLAAELNTNRTYLSRHINCHMGCNFKTWISSLRIEDAKSLLIENSELPAPSIGELVGISDKSSFHRQFLNITGLTPRDYRCKYRR